MKGRVAMQHIWKIRLSLIAIICASLGLMVHSFERMPENELVGVLAFVVFFASAMLLLYTAHMDERPVVAKKHVRAAVDAGVEHHFRSTGGGSGGGSGS